jgi:hypothetical protein
MIISIGKQNIRMNIHLIRIVLFIKTQFFLIFNFSQTFKKDLIFSLKLFL